MKILKTDYAALTSNAAATYTANDLNQYAVTSNPTEAFSHDFDGNMTLDRQFVYTWDAENRLMEVQTRIDWGQYSDAYEVNDKHVYFAYDYMGRRVRKRVETFNGTSWPETSDELFVYDGWNGVMVLNANAGNAITRKFTWGLDLSGTIHGAGGIGGLLAAFIPGAEPDDARLWYFYDGNGNVGQVLDATNTGNITLAAHYEYDPYGNLINGSGPYADLNPFRFSTKWYDVETGMYHYGYRYYLPRLGRWASSDPMGDKGGVNLFAFVGNKTTNQVDSLGNYGRETHIDATRAWAQNEGAPRGGIGGGLVRYGGFRDDAANRIGRWNNGVDGCFGPSGWILWGLDWHFDGDTQGGAVASQWNADDSRFVHSQEEVQRAIHDCAHVRDGHIDAARHLGRGLHPLQDFYAHGNWRVYFAGLLPLAHPDWYDWPEWDPANGVTPVQANDPNTPSGRPPPPSGTLGVQNRYQVVAMESVDYLNQFIDGVETEIANHAPFGACCLRRLLRNYPIRPRGAVRFPL